MEADAISGRGIRNSLDPCLKNMNVKRIKPANVKRMPIDSNGGMLSMTFAMAK
jgi:hypothetical protein